MKNEYNFCQLCSNKFSIIDGVAKHDNFPEMDAAHTPEKLKSQAEFDSVLEQIIYGVGRTFFVLAFADEHEDAAGPGEDFYDVCPDGVPVAYLNKAKDAATAFEEDNGIDLAKAIVLAASAEDIDSNEISEEYIEDFAHSTGMEYAGTGCGWTDNHKDYLIDGKEPKFRFFSTDI